MSGESYPWGDLRIDTPLNWIGSATGLADFLKLSD